MSMMKIQENLELINLLFSNNRLTKTEKYHILNIAKVSLNFDDLKENIKWEFFDKNIK